MWLDGYVDELAQVVDNQSGTPTFGYNVQGNLASRNGVGYTFDAGNRLRNVTGEEGGYAYDAWGRRVAQTDVSGTIYSFYDYSGQLIYQRDRDGGTHDDLYLGGKLVAIRDYDSSGIARVWRFQDTDAIGSVIRQTDKYGNDYPDTAVVYDAWGGMHGATPQDGPGYTGQVEDADTNLVYMQQRYYDPSVGRFLSMDPVDASGTDGSNLDRYWYAKDNPYRYTDPDGRFGRGTGFSNDDWKKFNAAQQSAAKSLQKAVDKITSAIASGGKSLQKAEANFEKSFGKGTGTMENMTKVAATMSSMVSALKDDGSHGFVANAMTSDAMSKTYSNFGPNVLAGVPPGSKDMVVNISSPGFSDAPVLSWATGHESGHAAAGLSDQSVNGVGAFKMGSPEQENAFKQLPTVDPAGAMQNPDTIMDYVH